MISVTYYNQDSQGPQQQSNEGTPEACSLEQNRGSIITITSVEITIVTIDIICQGEGRVRKGPGMREVQKCLVIGYQTYVIGWVVCRSDLVNLQS